MIKKNSVQENQFANGAPLLVLDITVISLHLSPNTLQLTTWCQRTKRKLTYKLVQISYEAADVTLFLPYIASGW